MTRLCIKWLLLIPVLSSACAQIPLKTPKVPLPPSPEIRKVEVRNCLKIQNEEPEVCLPAKSEWRFVTIHPLLLNFENLKNQIARMKVAPCWEAPKKPKSEMELAK